MLIRPASSWAGTRHLNALMRGLSSLHRLPSSTIIGKLTKSHPKFQQCPSCRILDLNLSLRLQSTTATTPRKQLSLRPFFQLSRLDKPIGSLLLYWPCTWSLTLAAQSCAIPPSTLAMNLALFGTGAFVMRGAGCTINDMWDSRIDSLVERTKSRPLAAGEVTHLQAWTWLGAQLYVGLAVLLQLNWYSIVLGASSLGVVVAYPLMKRITYWPQLVLGLAFNWGALLGWAALSPPPAWVVVLPLYAGSIFWTLIYDTIYAHQDKSDDVHAGVKSTALLFGDRGTKPILSAFSVASLALLAQAGIQASPVPSLLSFAETHPAFMVSLGAAAGHLTWQISTLDLGSRPDCWRKFISNQHVGLIIFLGLLADYALSRLQKGEAALKKHKIT